MDSFVLASNTANPTGYFFGGPVISEFESKVPPKELLEFCPASIKGFDLNLPDGPNEKISDFLAANWCCEKKTY